MMLLAAFVYAVQISSVMHASTGVMASGGAFDKSVGTNRASYDPSFEGNSVGGTLTLAVVQAHAPDGSTVFRVTQNGFNGGKPFMCAAYGDTGNVVCDANASLPFSTLLLLRVAGAGFYSPSRLDAQKHWRVVSPGRTFSETADFTVTKIAGPLVTIAMKRRSVQQQPPMHTSIDGTVQYDTSIAEPRAMDVTVTLRPDQPGAHPSSERIDVTLQH